MALVSAAKFCILEEILSNIFNGKWPPSDKIDVFHEFLVYSRQENDDYDRKYQSVVFSVLCYFPGRKMATLEGITRNGIYPSFLDRIYRKTSHWLVTSIQTHLLSVKKCFAWLLKLSVRMESFPSGSISSYIPF